MKWLMREKTRGVKGNKRGRAREHSNERENGSPTEPTITMTTMTEYLSKQY